MWGNVRELPSPTDVRLERRFAYACAGGLLSAGAPVGLLAVRGLRQDPDTGSTSWRRAIREAAGNPRDYVYVGVSTAFAFAAFGYVLGRQADRLVELSETDPLTGLANARRLFDRLEMELARSRRYREPLALLLVDLDGLKRINDRFGHHAGDEAIRGLADVIRSQLRETDVAARWGGDEFAVLAPSTSRDAAVGLAERIRALIPQGRAPWQLSGSLGVAAINPRSDGSLVDPATLMRAADAALYEAKRTGRNRVVVAPALHSHDAIGRILSTGAPAPSRQKEWFVIEFRQILCPTDLSESSTRVLTYAAAVARWYDATLTVLHVVPTFDPMPVGPESLEGVARVVYPASREEVLDGMRRVVESAGAGLLDSALAAEAGDPVRTIVDQALTIPADLIVMGTHGRSGVERFMIGSVTEKVLRKAPCPVLTVPPHATATLPADVLFKNILCPMDFSPSALQAMGFALDLARQADGAVTLLHVVEWLPEEEPRAGAHFNVPEYRQHLIEDARHRLQTLASEEPRTWSAVQEVVTVGRAYREVLRLAVDSQPDLIVMGAQGRGGIGLALFGSTTQQVVRAAPCSVLTVRGTPAA